MISLYIHIPFCTSKCAYCDFLSFASPDDDEVFRYLHALNCEMALYRGERINTVYIGGGTPSILTTRQFGFITEKLYSSFNIIQDAEFTLEANPESVDRQKVRAWKSSGINRVSLGVQSFEDSVLEQWARKTRRADSIRAVEILSEENINNFNIDLILGLQAGRDVAAGVGLFKKDLAEAAALKPAHISVYMLSIHEGGGFALSSEALLFDDSTYEKLYYRTVGFLSSFGYSQYEVSNFAKKGFRSKHNINYWRSGQYIGVGLGAVTTRNGIREKNTQDLGKYIEVAEKGLKPIAETEVLGKRELLYERIILALRMTGGIKLSELECMANVKYKVHLDRYINELQNLGYAEKKTDRLCLTSAGFFRSNYIIARLLRFISC